MIKKYECGIVGCACTGKETKRMNDSASLKYQCAVIDMNEKLKLESQGLNLYQLEAIVRAVREA